MLFNSLSFLGFFPVVTIVYFLLPFRYRWIWLLIASYYFYMNWEPVYSVLLFFSTAVTFYSSKLIQDTQSQRMRRIWLWSSLLLNFGLLGIFKYYNFVTESISLWLAWAHIKMSVPKFTLLLPVGISFYVFQAVGYTIDVYRGTVKAEQNLGKYALFVSFFPQLVAGPIERTGNLLPQLKKDRVFIYQRFWRGLRLMMYGFFMKLVVADRLSIYVDSVYNNADHHTGLTLIIATIFFSFQIYCDFAGYSAIAIGASRAMGISLMTNFRRPYLSKSIGEFWRRWHISLSTWFKDYLYIALGGSRVTKARMYVNLFITFLISGLWHGANWTFVIWGGLNGAYLVLENALGIAKGKATSAFVTFIRVVYVFILIGFSWIFFRSNTLHDAITIIQSILRFNTKIFIPADPEVLMYCSTSVILILGFEVFYEYVYKRRTLLFNRTLMSNVFMVFLVICIMLFGVFDGGQFIYFQF